MEKIMEAERCSRKLSFEPVARSSLDGKPGAAI